MITLITGAPGAGKSAACVSMLQEIAKGRPVFVDGIPELTVEHSVIDAKDWPTAVPDGSMIVIDEVQRVWRPSGPGAKIPDSIALLETHRHRGLDFIIITQHPKLVHANVRALVGRHVHLRDLGVLGRHWYEWPEAGNPEQFRSAPVKKRYKLPKRVFGAYKSATEHIKPVRSVPPSMVVAIVAAVVLVGLVGRIVWRVASGPDELASPSPAVAASAPPKSASVVWSSGNGGGKLITGASLLRDMQPRLAADPGSAAAYDHLRVVTVMPRVVGGYCREGKCRCFTQQGSDPGIPHDACAELVRSPPFDPYRVDDRAAVRQPELATAPPSL